MKEWPHYEDYEIATCLDPRFKILAWTDVERHERAWSKLANLPRNSPTKRMRPTKENEKVFFFFANDEDSQGKVKPQLTSHRSVPQVWRRHEVDMKWWRGQSDIPRAGTAREEISVQPSYACLLRTCFKCGRNVNKQRNSFHSKNVDEPLCLRSWKRLEECLTVPLRVLCLEKALDKKNFCFSNVRQREMPITLFL